MIAMIERLEPRRLMSSYYLSPQGKDSAAGSLAAPFQTLSKALSVAKSGDTITLRGGTYAGNVIVRQPKITIQGYPRETAKITSPINNPLIYFAIDFDIGASGGVLRNLDLSGGYYYTLKTETNRDTDNTNGIYHGASSLLIDGVKLHDSGTHVVKLSPDSDKITFRHCEIYNSGKRDPTDAQGVDAVNVDDLLFEENYIHDVAQNAIFVKGGSQRSIIRDNEIRNAGFGGILLGQDTDGDAFDTRQNPGMYEAIDCIAINNRVSHTGSAGLAAWSSLRCRFEGNYVKNAGFNNQAGFFVTMNHFEKPNVSVTFKNNTLGVNKDDELISIVYGALTGQLTMSGNRYFGENRFLDNRTAFLGNLAQWQAYIKGDFASTYSATTLAVPTDFDNDGKLDIDEYAVFDFNFASHYWAADLNLDGKIDVGDYSVLDFSYAKGLQASSVAFAARPIVIMTDLDNRDDASTSPRADILLA
jgi:hypothetical protein